jgi:ribosome-associated protein
MDESFLRITPHLLIPISEIAFRTSRSGGPGGQNVNKIETKVELLFDVIHSPSLTQYQRITILEHLKDRIDSAGVLHVIAQQSRSQYQNKEVALDHSVRLLRDALKPKKSRIRTKPTRAAKASRMQAKRHLSEKKQLRKNFPE